MADIEAYAKEAVRFLDGVKRGNDPQTLIDEYGIIATNPHDEDENGKASITFTLGGPTVYLTIDDTVEFYYHFGEDEYTEVLSDNPETVEAAKRFVEETS